MFLLNSNLKICHRVIKMSLHNVKRMSSSNPSPASIYGKVLIGGGSGFIGTNLGNHLRSIGVEVINISRMPARNSITWHDIQADGIPPGVKAVVNLAGQPVLDPKRQWTEGLKQNVLSSRVSTTRTLAKAIEAAKEKPNVFVSMSGVGFYKPSETEEYTEDSHGGDFDFFSNLCKEWEEASELPPEIGVRNVTIRCGVVLGKKGGMIENILTPFWLGVGGPIGSGNQFFPWIHIDDISGLIMFAIEEPNVSGVLNGVAPQIITNNQFTKAFGKALFRPTIFRLPAFLIRFIFGPERAIMVLEGQKVIPKRVQQLGFKYLFPDINSACEQIANS